MPAALSQLRVPDMLDSDLAAGRCRSGTAFKQRRTENKVTRPSPCMTPLKILICARTVPEPLISSGPWQENEAPNVYSNIQPARLPSQQTRPEAKRVRKVKKVPRKLASTAEESEPVDTAAVVAKPAAVEVPPRANSPRANKQQKVGDGGAMLLRRCAGVPAAGESEVSPPLDKVQERFTAYAQHAQATATRGSSSLAMCVQQADGSGPREVDWLVRSVAVCKLANGGL